MDLENQDAPEVLETPEEELELDLDNEAPESEEDTEALKEKNRQLYARAKKAEGFEQVDGKWVKKAQEPAHSENTNLSPKEVIALSRVHDDDIDQVLEWAKFKNVSIPDALQDSTLKSILDVKAEERKTAQATQTGRTARGASKSTGEDLLRKAEQTGEIPESEEGMRAIIEAKQNRLRTK